MFSREIIGLEAGDNRISLACAAVSRKGFKILSNQSCSVNLHDGQITDQEAFQEAFMHFRRSNKIKTDKVAIDVRTSKAIVRFEQFPPMNGKERRAAIENSLENCFPIDTRDYNIDYKILSNNRRSVYEDTHVMFVGLPHEISLGYTQALAGLKLKPLCIDIFQNSVARYYAEIDNGNFVIISELPGRINLVFVSKRCIGSISDLTYTSADGGIREMEKYFAYKGLGFDRVYLLSRLDWVKGYFEKINIEVLLDYDELVPLKGLLAREDFR